MLNLRNYPHKSIELLERLSFGSYLFIIPELINRELEGVFANYRKRDSRRRNFETNYRKTLRKFNDLNAKMVEFRPKRGSEETNFDNPKSNYEKTHSRDENKTRRKQNSFNR